MCWQQQCFHKHYCYDRQPNVGKGLSGVEWRIVEALRRVKEEGDWSCDVFEAEQVSPNGVLLPDLPPAAGLSSSQHKNPICVPFIGVEIKLC